MCPRAVISSRTKLFNRDDLITSNAQKECKCSNKFESEFGILRKNLRTIDHRKEMEKIIADYHNHQKAIRDAINYLQYFNERMLSRRCDQKKSF